MRKIPHFAGHTWFAFTRWRKSFFLHSEKYYHLTIIVATILTGSWAFYIFVVERHSQPHLGMDLKITVSTNSPALVDRRLVFLDVILSNEGTRKLEAKRVPTTQIAYQDPGETLKYSCGIQIREILTSLIQINKALDWFNDTNRLQCPGGIPGEIDLLGEYEELIAGSNQSDSAIPEFWIEPGEQYHLGTTLVLPRGNYLLRIHFIGTHPEEDFWSRIVFMQIG